MNLGFAQTSLECDSIEDEYFIALDASDCETCLSLSMELLSCVGDSEGHKGFRYATSLSWVADEYFDLGDYKQAEKFYARSMKLFQRLGEAKSEEYAVAAFNRGFNAEFLGDDFLAEAMYLETLQIERALFDASDPDIAVTLYFIGRLYSYTFGDFDSAESYFLAALEIQKMTLGEYHPDVSQTLYDLGFNASMNADYVGSEAFYSQALEIDLAEANRPNAPDSLLMPAIVTLNVMGINAQKTGEYLKAEAFFERALNFCQDRSMVDGCPGLDMSLNNMGMLARQMGDYERSYELLTEGLEVAVSFVGVDDYDIALLRYNLGATANLLGHHDEALLHLEQALETFELQLSPVHPDVAMVLNELGHHAQKVGEVARAEKLMRSALDIQIESVGANHRIVAETFIKLADLMVPHSRYDEALEFLKTARKVLNRTLPDNHPDMAQVDAKMGYAFLHNDEIKSSIASFEKAFIAEKDFVKRTFIGMSSKQKILFWAQRKELLSNLVRLSVASGSNRRALELAYNGLLFGKGLLLHSSREIDEAITEFGDSAVSTAYNELKACQQFLVRAYGDGNQDPMIVSDYENRLESLEKFLSAEVAEFSGLSNRAQVNWKDVQDMLELGEAAVEFGQFLDGSRSQIVAMVVLPTSRHPKLVSLCPEESLQVQWATVEANELNDLISMDLEKFHSLLWEPLSEALVGVKRIYYSSIGAINQLPIHSMYAVEETENRKYVMDDFELIPISSTRFIRSAKELNASNEGQSILALGYPDYDALPPELISGSYPSHEHSLPSDDTQFQVQRSRSGVDSFLPFGSLGGTLLELEGIKMVLDKSKWDVQSLKGISATEHELKSRLASGPASVLHIATHGFAFPSRINEVDWGDMASEQLKTYFRSGEDPLSRVGLVLAGGNAAWMGQPESWLDATGEDGILTASEIASLQLHGLSLVVLSACETGLGAVDGLEGTLGLFRAFKLAGANQVIQSLWRVPDRETKEMMLEFYKNLASGQTVQQAFRAARMTMRHLYPDQPANWAGFVLNY